MQSRSNDKLPIYNRLYSSKANGGPTVKHLRAMAERLYAQFPSARVPEENSQYVLASYIERNFDSSHIQRVHDELRAFYSDRTRNSRYQRYSSQAVPTPTTIDITPQPRQLPAPQDHRSNPNTDSNNDEKYVLRKDYDNDIIEHAEEIHKLEKKLAGVSDIVAANMLPKLAELNAKIEAIQLSKPTIVELRQPDAAPITTGIVHKSFPQLLKVANSRNPDGTRANAWLYGPAGTGKTHAAELLANTLFGNAYQEQASVINTIKSFFARFNRNWSNYNYNGSLTSSFQVLGYMDANGKYVPTPFRFAWEFGGVYLFDEIDGSMPDALLALNGALSSSICSFPDGMVKRHPDCVILAGANTTGLGGGIEYVGAMKQNAAFLDRWDYVNWPHDDGLEEALCSNKQWLARVRVVRSNWKREQIKGHLITMRATFKGQRLLAAGLAQEVVEEMVLKCGLTDAQWRNIR